MADHDALGAPGRAAGVHQIGNVIRSRSHRGLVRGGLSEQMLIVQRARIADADADSQTDAAGLRRDAVCRLRELACENQHVRLAVLTDAGELRSR